MDWKKLFEKLMAGEELTPDEKKYLKDHAPDADESRIPKTRLDQEITKRKNAEQQVTDLTSKIEELTGKVEELESKDLSEADKVKRDTAKEIEKLQKQVKDLTEERDGKAKALADTEFKTKVSGIAAKYNFVDSDYLQFRIKSGEIDLDDEKAVSAFVKELEKNSPNLFKSSAKPGSGTGTEKVVTPPATSEQRLKELLAKPELSRREVAEVHMLQEELTGEADKNA